MPLVYIVILNWNGLSDSVECLNSIKVSNYTNYRVVLVDNCSTENPSVFLRHSYPWVTVIENDRNLGFTGGNNLAIKYALTQGADYLWLLNNDTTVDACCLKHLVETAEVSDRVGMVSPVIYYSDDPRRKQFSGSCLDLENLTLSFPDLSDAVADTFMSGDNVALWGTALLIKAELIRRIGLLNEKYFAYWEDTEYSFRALRAGYENKVCPVAAIHHKTSSRETVRVSRHYHYYMVRNRILFCREHLTARKMVRFYRNQLANLCVTIQSYHDIGAFEVAQARLDGFIDGIYCVTGPLGDSRHRLLKKVFTSVILRHPYFYADLLEADFSKTARHWSNLTWRRIFHR